jgi:hypothetical protein
MKVNRTTKVANLNADKLDGKNATQLGVNGLQIVVANSLFNSSSPKGATATCPAGKVVVGAGYDISGGTSGDPGNEVIDVVPDALLPGSTTVTGPQLGGASLRELRHGAVSEAAAKAAFKEARRAGV